MTAHVSRAERWGATEAKPRTALARRTDEALASAAAAGQSARLRLGRHDRRSRAGVVLQVALGAAGGAVLAGLPLVHTGDRVSRLVALGLGAVAVLLALGLLAVRAWRVDTHREALVAMIERDRSVASQARRLGRAAESMEEGLSLGAYALLIALIEEMEGAIGAARAREARLHAEARAKGRRHERIKPQRARVVVTAADGRQLTGNVIDVSLSGVAVEGNFPRCDIDMPVQVGSRNAKVVRVLPNGLAFAFERELSPALLGPDIVL